MAVAVFGELGEAIGCEHISGHHVAALLDVDGELIGAYKFITYPGWDE